jgi:hypothetical protein
MKRRDLEHVIRAAAVIADDDEAHAERIRLRIARDFG